MGRLRYNRESFGCTVSFPDGRMGLYAHEVAPLLVDDVSHEDIARYRLETIQIDTDFHLNAPLIVWIELTRKCNLRCRHCYVGAGEPLEGELSTEELCLLLEDLKGMKALSLVITGGEPTLHKDFAHILRYACELGFVIGVATNGLPLTQEGLDQLPRTYEDLRVNVSLDGAGQYNPLRGEVSFKQITDKLLLLKDNGILTAVMAALSSRNIDGMRKIFEWCVEHEIVFRTGLVSPLGRGGEGENSSFMLGPMDVEKASSLWLDETLFEMEMNKSIGACVAKIFDYTFELDYSTKRCKGGRSLAYVCANGDVYPCSIGASTSTFKAGNLREKKFSEIWQDSFHEIRGFTWGDFKDCARCELSTGRYFCTNRCPPLSLRYRGSPSACGALPVHKMILKKRTELLHQALGVS